MSDANWNIMEDAEANEFIPYRVYYDKAKEGHLETVLPCILQGSQSPPDHTAGPGQDAGRDAG